MKIVDETKPETRALWGRKAETPEGDRILREARRLACTREYCMLSDGELIRLAYWGASGEKPNPRDDVHR
jgi:hypothetical protein